MKTFTFIAVAVLAMVAYSTAQLVLTDETFESQIEDHDLAVIKFYAPWCGHCKKMAADYSVAAKKLKVADPPVTLIDVDCTVETKTCEKYGVKGYPTLKIFRKGVAVGDYEGPRDAEGMVKFMKLQSGPSAKELNTVAEYKAFLASDDSAVVGFFETESKLMDSFQKVADTERDRFRFGFSTNKEVLAKVGYTDDIIVYAPSKLLNKFDAPEFKYDGNYDTDKIKAFLIHDTNGLAGYRTQENLFQFTARPLFVAYYNVDYVKDPKGSNYWRNRVLKVAQDYKRKATFAVSSKDAFDSEIESAGLADRKDSDKPIIAAFSADGKFRMESEFSMDNLRDFVDLVLSGKAEPFFKSEPVPETQDNVKIAVARNFKELITDATSDVLIYFYAPWCGHCKTLAPVFEDLADKLANEDVILAKLDATANDVPPGFNVQGFPTLFWIPKNTKTPVPYSGGRDAPSFIKFIAAHSTDGLKAFDKAGKPKKAEL